MCQRVTCSKCNKPTFAGCGAHVEQVLGNVPKAERCQCREQAAAKKRENSGEEAAPARSKWWPF